MLITVEKALLINLADFVTLVLSQRYESLVLRDGRFTSNEQLFDSYVDVLRRLLSPSGFVYGGINDSADTFFFVARALILSDNRDVRDSDVSLWNYVLGVLRSGEVIKGDTTFDSR